MLQTRPSINVLSIFSVLFFVFFVFFHFRACQFVNLEKQRDRSLILLLLHELTACGGGKEPPHVLKGCPGRLRLWPSKLERLLLVPLHRFIITSSLGGHSSALSTAFFGRNTNIGSKNLGLWVSLRIATATARLNIMSN